MLRPGGLYLWTSLSGKGRNELLVDNGLQILVCEEDAKGNHRVVACKQPLAEEIDEVLLSTGLHLPVVSTVSATGLLDLE